MGTVGFTVDAALMILLFEMLQFGLEVSRIAAFLCAATVNWILNRVFTFAERNREGRKSLQWLRFVATAVFAAIPNLGIFFLLMLVLPETLVFVMLAMCCGILAGYYCNYQLSRLWVFGTEAS